MVRTSGLLHPVALIALAVWQLNDHWLAAAYPGWVTGKLTELGCLVVFPLVVAALVGLGLPGRMYPRVVDAAIAATGLAFVLVKLWEPANHVLESALGVIYRSDQPVLVERDWTDLIALPMLAVSRWCYRTARRRPGEPT
jgi:hypothetical protein